MLSFTNPSALWLLLLMIPLILLYLLKKKRIEMIVPSVMLWKEAIEDSKAHTPFQKLRSNLLLLLQLFIIALVTAVLSEPHLASSYQKSQRWILVIDTSASMQSTDVLPDRFHEARKQLLKLIASLPATDQIMLISLSSDASILQSFSSQHDLIRSKLEALGSEDLAENWNQLRSILDPLFKEDRKPRLVIASDFANMPPSTVQGFTFDALPVGRSDENAGIVHALLRGVPESLEVQELFYEIKNSSSRKRDLSVELKTNDNTIDAYDTALGANETLQRSVRLEIREPSRISIQIQPADFLKIDNDFLMMAEPRKKIEVQIAGTNPFLLNALRVIPSVRTAPAASILIGTQALPDRAGIFFSAAKSAGCSGPIVDWNTVHPTLRFVDAGLWQFASCTLLNAPASADTLLELEQGIVGYAEQIGAKRRIVMGFLPEQSNMVLLAGFPIFLQNSIEWIAEGLNESLPILTDERFPHEGPIKAQAVKGYVNFENERESNISPAHPKTGSLASANLVQVRRDVSFWFLILLTGIVMLEWYVFHRRIEI